MKEKEKKKQIAKISIFITSLFVIFLSVTYAFINMTLTGTRRQVITAGNLELQLLEDENNLTITNAMPMYDDVGMIQEAFTFRLINKTATDTNYTLKLVDITTSDKLSTDIVKYGLTKDGAVTIDTLTSIGLVDSGLDESIEEDQGGVEEDNTEEGTETGEIIESTPTLNDNSSVDDEIPSIDAEESDSGILDKGVISGKQTIEYSLRLWIDSSVEDNTVISGKNLSYRIDVEVRQEVVQTGPSGTMKYYDEIIIGGLPYRDQAYYKYKHIITQVIFENKIDIPSTIDEDKKWDVSEEQNGSVMAYVEENGTSADGNTTYKLHIQGDGGIYANENCSILFGTWNNIEAFDLLESIEGLEYFDISKVTDMRAMFQGCKSLTSLDLSNFDTSNVKTMFDMFSGCSSLTNLDLSNFDTSNVTDMSGMFFECSSLTSLDLSNFDTSNVTDMSSMFSRCSSLTNLDLSNFNTSDVTTMISMFLECSSLISLDLSNFDISNVIGTLAMFNHLKTNCIITVKDEAMKAWVLEQNSGFTNVVVKGV